MLVACAVVGNQRWATLLATVTTFGGLVAAGPTLARGPTMRAASAARARPAARRHGGLIGRRYERWHRAFTRRIEAAG